MGRECCSTIKPQTISSFHPRSSQTEVETSQNGIFQVELIPARMMYRLLLSLRLVVILMKTWRCVISLARSAAFWVWRACETVSFSLLRCSAMLNSVTPLTEQIHAPLVCPVLKNGMQYSVVAVLIGSLIPRPARCTGRKKISSSSFEILPWKSAGRKCLQMASHSVWKSWSERWETLCK